ncbi:hypothetical protein [Natrialba sp. PRR66]|uniref:hypothetical protein n=1 Tax=Natrialba sp. PRR66 TaxID=3098146 RepID=UPI002B1D3603|nr:hypothetical protein [Natrialba sp. PRR66]
MKRTLTITLTVALVGGLMFMGFAGTAAAQDGLIGVDIGDDVGVNQSANATTDVSVDQSNSNDQAQESLALSSNGASEAVGAQAQEVTQDNSASVENVSSTATNDADVDTGTIEINVTADIGIGDGILPVEEA